MNQRYALMSSDTISIFDNLTLASPKIFFYKRNNNSIYTKGNNNWFQWITENSFAFGTCAGHIFLFSTLPIGQKIDPIIIEAGGMITSSFSAYGHLGLCLLGPIILFLNQSGEVFSKLHFSSLKNEATSLSNCNFMTQSSKLMFTSNSIPNIISLSKTSFLSKFSLNVQLSFDISCLFFEYNFTYNITAFALPDGTVLITENDSPFQTFNYTIGSKGGQILYMKWINLNSQLLIIKAFSDTQQSTDSVLVWNYNDHSLFTSKYPELNDPNLCFSFDNSAMRLISVGSGKLIFLNFIKLVPPLAFTSTTIFNVLQSEIITELSFLPKERILSPSAFPISAVCSSFDSNDFSTKKPNKIAIAGGSIIARISHKHLRVSNLLSHNIRITALAMHSNLIFAFSHSDQGSNAIVFNKKLQKIASFSTESYIVSATSFGSRVVGFGNDLVIVIDNDPQCLIRRPPLIKNSRTYLELDQFSSVITQFSFGTLLSAAQPSFDDVYVLTSKGDLIQLQTNSVKFKGINRIWMNNDPRFLFVQDTESTQILIYSAKSNYEIVKLKNLPISSSCYSFIYSNSSRKFLPFDSIYFINFLLMNALNNPQKCAFIMDHIPFKLWNSFVFEAIQKGKLLYLINLFNEFSFEQKRNFIQNISHDIVYYLASTRIFFEQIFDVASPQIRAQLIINADPELFCLISEKLSLLGSDGSQVASKLLINGKWIYAMKVASITGAILDFNSVSSQFSFSEYHSELKKLVDKIEKQMICYSSIFFNFSHDESKFTRLGDGISLMKMLGCGFLSTSSFEGELIGLACLIVARERKRIIFVLKSNPNMLTISKDYISDNPSDSSACFLNSIISTL